jgi:hypothetical protein
MCAESHIHQSCGRLPKKIFSTKGYTKIHIQRLFFDNTNSIWKILGLKIRIVEACSSASSTRRSFFFLKNTKISIFGGISSLGKFWQILAILGSMLHSQWLRACPNLDWNLQNPITFQLWVQMLHATACWKATIHIYSLKKFPKIKKFIASIIACLRM